MSGVRSATPRRRAAAASTSAAVGSGTSSPSLIRSKRRPAGLRRASGRRPEYRWAAALRCPAGDRRLLVVRVGGLGRALLQDVGPGDDLEPPVGMLGDRGAALDPVTAIDVADAEILVDRGEVDVAAD